MLARNATIYTFTPEAASKLNATLDAALDRAPFKPCAATEATSIGFVPFAPKEGDKLVRRAGRLAAFTLRIDQKILPACVIRSELDARAADIEEQQGRRVGRKERRDLKERITEELLAKAFIRSIRVSGWFDFATRLLVIDTTSESRADAVIGVLFKALDDAGGIQRWRMQEGVTTTMTNWIRTGEAPPSFTLDDRALLAGHDGAKVRLTKQTVTADEIMPLIKAGKDCVEIAMTYEDKLSFVLTDKLLLKRLCYIDVEEETNPEQKDLMPEELLDAELTLSAGTVARVVTSLTEAFQPQEEELAEAA